MIIKKLLEEDIQDAAIFVNIQNALSTQRVKSFSDTYVGFRVEATFTRFNETCRQFMFNLGAEMIADEIEMTLKSRIWMQHSLYLLVHI